MTNAFFSTVGMLNELNAIGHNDKNNKPIFLGNVLRYKNDDFERLYRVVFGTRIREVVSIIDGEIYPMEITGFFCQDYDNPEIWRLPIADDGAWSDMEIIY